MDASLNSIQFIAWMTMTKILQNVCDTDDFTRAITLLCDNGTLV